MNALIDFIIMIFQTVLFVAFVVGVIAFFGYNKLRALSESIREAWSNIGVLGRKQVSLVNQLIDVVKGYQESEKLIMLKVSDDMSNAASVSQMYQQSGMVLSSINGLAEKFPELKVNEQYMRLIDSIQSCEAQLEAARVGYNANVRTYNTARSSIPTVFFAPLLGFKAAPYLEFDGNGQTTEMGAMKVFSGDDDGERLNALLGKAGGKILEISGKTLDAGRQAANLALEQGKSLAEKTQEQFSEKRSAHDNEEASASDEPRTDPTPTKPQVNDCSGGGKLTS